MTAVVGILNKHAVAIAADSAVTIGGSVKRKIFNSANKVFTLSKIHPVGIMIYNSANFMDTPWETLIKMYRKQLGNKSFDTVKAYQEDFFQYLKNHNYFTDTDSQKRALFGFALNLLNRVLNMIKEEKPTLFNSDTPENRNEILNQFEHLSDTYYQVVQASPNTCDDLLNFSEEDFTAFAEEPINVLIDSEFASKKFVVPDSLKVSFKKLVYSYVRTKEDQTSYTGLIFTGFGEAELYPQLVPVNVSFVVDNKLRYYIDDQRDASITHNTTGAIRSFAQTDVINTILTGIDPLLDTTYLENFKASFDKYNKEIINILGDSNPELTAKIKAIDIQTLREEYNKKNAETKQINYIEPLMDAVSSLSKEDLAEMAESLIYLTYLKRRITFAEESVGGPVDVAIISKGDGFIWIKRKHYFKPELNRYFFDNYFNT